MTPAADCVSIAARFEIDHALLLLSVNLDRKMRGAQRVQKISRIKDLAGGEDARTVGVSGNHALRRFDHERRRDGVDIPPPTSRYGIPARIAASITRAAVFAKGPAQLMTAAAPASARSSAD
jgi:hypothetical protein